MAPERVGGEMRVPLLTLRTLPTTMLWALEQLDFGQLLLLKPLAFADSFCLGLRKEQVADAVCAISFVWEQVSRS
jgi:hypothetical protein